jgi:hypothetical protein
MLSIDLKRKPGLFWKGSASVKYPLECVDG